MDEYEWEKLETVEETMAQVSHWTLKGFRRQRKHAKHRGRNLLASVGVGGETDTNMEFVLGHGKSSWRSRNRIR